MGQRSPKMKRKKSDRLTCRLEAPIIGIEESPDAPRKKAGVCYITPRYSTERIRDAFPKEKEQPERDFGHPWLSGFNKGPDASDDQEEAELSSVSHLTRIEDD